MPQVFVGDDDQSESGLFGFVEEFAVGQSAPAHLSGGFDFMGGKGVANLNGHALVQQDSHACA